MTCVCPECIRRAPYQWNIRILDAELAIGRHLVQFRKTKPLYLTWEVQVP